MNRSVRSLPLLAIPAVVIAGAIAVPAMASADTSSATKTPQQVLALIAKAKDVSYSGTLQQTSDLGLPQLPSSASGSTQDSASNVLELLSGTHKLRVFVDGPTKQRAQVLDSLAERDVIRNGSTVWTWDSKKQEATKVTLPSASAARKSDTTVTPAALADRLVKAVKPTSTLKVMGGSSVAGRDVYTLTLTPKTDGTLVEDVKLAVDTQTGLPLRLTVDAVGQKDAAFSVGFSSIDVAKPDAKLFDFSAPKGADVTTRDLSNVKHPRTHGPVSPDVDANRPTTTGTGWSTIAVLPASGKRSTALSGADAQGLLGQLTQTVPGGRAVQTSLVSVLFADDGRVLVGAVPVSALQAAAG